MTDKPLPSMVELTPFNPVYQANPHEVLDDLRERCPAHRDPTPGSLILTRYADVRGRVNNPTLLRAPIRGAAQGAPREDGVRRPGGRRAKHDAHRIATPGGHPRVGRAPVREAPGIGTMYGCDSKPATRKQAHQQRQVTA